MVTGREGLQTESVVCCTVRCCLCVWYLFVSILEIIFISDMWKSFACSCALCTCDNSAFLSLSLVTAKGNRSGWGRWSVVIQESCSFEGWVCTCVFTFCRVKINSNTKTLFGTETFLSFSEDWLLGRGLVPFSNHSAHSSNLFSLVAC